MGAIVNGKAWVASGGTDFNPSDLVEGGYYSAHRMKHNSCYL
ncbi:hypothetical protein SAMN05444128_3855 [Pontibacter indicus]|uniref:Uncharacterized protein n=1 Tax=Pontibacter indicus TaxID=1317125 RepID=A0A1R3XT01_9BACT|nr:hypothetical protein SAMN05444128_3855 [Pontibacter indicus]